MNVRKNPHRSVFILFDTFYHAPSTVNSLFFGNSAYHDHERGIKTNLRRRSIDQINDP
uniref:Uncharacterized protein n=1 Tax=Hyaloperonospora arabidopsidis (strain Emoy2) TaxID=559515 RepID=M4BGP3_HYAAE